MASKVLNFKMDEAEILDLKQVAGVFHLSVTELVREAIRAYLLEMKQDPFYRLTAQVQEASPEESEEILGELDRMTDEDLRIASSKRFTL
ncbi:MAG: hypothetical protein IKS66_01735 [Oscillospiraceae bacterium]|nr:hypothetical protein [Oscillospiraceae bacterium]